MSQLPKQNSQQKDSKIPSAKSYVKYSGLVFQMLGIIIFGVLAGRKIDNYFSLNKPIFSGIFALSATALALYVALKDFLIPKK